MIWDSLQSLRQALFTWPFPPTSPPILRGLPLNRKVGLPESFAGDDPTFGRGGWGGGGGYGMVWYTLRYREWLAGRSLTLPVFRAGVRGQLAVTLGCRTPGFGGGGGCCCFLLIDLPVPPCSCLLCRHRSRGPCAVRPCANQAQSHAHWSGVLVDFSFKSPILSGARCRAQWVRSPVRPGGPAHRSQGRPRAQGHPWPNAT